MAIEFVVILLRLPRHWLCWMFWLVNAKLMMGWSEELTTNIYTDLDSGLLGLGVYCLLPVICLILLF